MASLTTRAAVIQRVRELLPHNVSRSTVDDQGAFAAAAGVRDCCP